MASEFFYIIAPYVKHRRPRLMLTIQRIRDLFVSLNEELVRRHARGEAYLAGGDVMLDIDAMLVCLASNITIPFPMPSLNWGGRKRSGTFLLDFRSIFTRKRLVNLKAVSHSGFIVAGGWGEAWSAELVSGLDGWGKRMRYYFSAGY
jgi:hypothetical protein